MRTIRALAIASAVAASAVAFPNISAAQAGRQFNDAWFWGVKAGGFSFGDSTGRYKQAPQVGLEWLITRTHGGLYVSASQAFLRSQALTISDPSDPTNGQFRAIDLRNLRKLDVAIMGFPGEHLRFHPYAGIGFTFAEVANATARGPFDTEDELTYANQVIENTKAGFTPLAIVGGQYRFSFASAFGQLTVNPAQSNFILYGGRPFDIGYELGIRYNIGGSIDKE